MDGVKEHGLLFVAPMARAAVAGIKTQTRRLPTASNSLVDGVGISAKRWAAMRFDWSRAVIDAGPSPAGNAGPYIKVPSGNGETWHRIYPRYEVGDRIWGRETHCAFEVGRVHYRADYSEHSKLDREHGVIWTPSIHMPRWAARIVRDITAVRVERLQDISEADARAEGAPPSHPSIDAVSREFGYKDFPRSWYAQLWDSINGSGSWDANPPVIVIEFAGVQP